jgi:hypothetical protein
MRTLLLSIIAMMAIPAQAETSRALTDQEKAVIEQAVRDNLKDPESARFKWLKTADAGEYCGAVNAKNAKNEMGGYGGFKSFLIPVRRDGSGQIIETVEPIDWIDQPDDSYGEVSSAAMRRGLMQRCAEASGQ